MTGYFKNIPLFKKILLLSFLITFMIITITVIFSYYLQSKQMKDLLSDHALDTAAIWATTINYEDVESVIDTKNESDPHLSNLKTSLSILNEKNTIHLNSFIVEGKQMDEGEIFMVASDQTEPTKEWLSLSSYKKNEEWMKGFHEALHSKQLAHSEVYHDSNGTWITAFSPIQNDKGEMIALFGVDIHADSIVAVQKKYAFILVSLFLIIAPCIYYIVNKGLIRIMEPVNELINGFDEVSKGNFDVSLNVQDHSELRLLCDRFNLMTQQLSILIEKLKNTSEKLSSQPQNIMLNNLEEVFDEVDNMIEKSKLFRELQRAEKMNAIGQLAASVAHEIRNPMTVVKGFLQIFLAKEQMSEEERMYIRLMIEEMDRAEIIINDYLSLAKPDMEQTESIAGRELAEKAMDLMNSYAMMSKNIAMETPVLEEVAIKGNKSELQQVLINMLKNGIEAMKDGGQLHFSLYQKGKYGVFEISDTGIGMTEEEMKRLGTAFYSLKEKGTGMGLAVCYQIIERMKGRIEVTSEKGIGTTFKIYVPRWE
ncbi:HAMP domain-containing protein [Bacillus sp. V3B]|uniref:sensor histidine kinase n=1 Tax=Bacillus sp. V3B TaxID=2804915 RepID=UPI00210A02DB|nr:ATP-binding protein [Bacillus sp. V3B]MCQ6277458.1 HAMP domain-containing protein [Bacillus sp. V3B]